MVTSLTHLPLLHQGAPEAPEARVVLGCFHQAPPEKEVNNNEKEVISDTWLDVAINFLCHKYTDLRSKCTWY